MWLHSKASASTTFFVSQLPNMLNLTVQLYLVKSSFHRWWSTRSCTLSSSSSVSSCTRLVLIICKSYTITIYDSQDDLYWTLLLQNTHLWSSTSLWKGSSSGGWCILPFFSKIKGSSVSMWLCPQPWSEHYLLFGQYMRLCGNVMCWG